MLRRYAILLLVSVTAAVAQSTNYNTQLTARPFVSVKQGPFLAKGDGSTNDTAAIRSAINSACGGSLYFPAGTYMIAKTITDAPILPLCSNIAISGPGTVKIINSSGSYFSVFGPASTAISIVSITGITIDMNSTGNPPTSSGDLGMYARVSFYTGHGGTNNSIEGVHITDIRSEWSIFVDSDSSRIVNNLLDNVGGGSVALDSSLIYTDGHATGAIVTGNRVVASARNVNLAITAIETHASATVSNNSIQDMRTGANITGIGAATTVGVVVNSNIVYGAYQCITLWSGNEEGATGYGLNGATVTGNSCTLNQRSYITLGGAPSGIVLSVTSTLPFANIKINHNMVSFDLSNTGTDPINTASIGVGYWDSLNTNSCDACDFSGNTVNNAPAAAFRYAAGGSNISFDDEVAINPGSSPNSGLSGSFRVGFILSNFLPITGFISIKGGTFIDSLPTSRMVYGMDFVSVAGPNPIVVDGAEISCRDATCASLLASVIANADTSPYIRITTDVPTALVIPIGAYGTQSTVYSKQGGITYLWNGASWASVGNSIASTTSTLRGNGSGSAVAVTGTGTDCVLVNGSSGACAAGGANAGLSNLSGVSINTSLLAQTGVDAGSTTAPFRNLFLWGSGTFGSTYLELTGTPTGARVITLPNATDTLMGKATTDTLTNKTFNTAGTGNSFSINSVAITAVQGNTAKVQLAGAGSPASNDCAKFDASGNIVTAGSACNTSGITALTGDVTASGSGSVAATVVRINGTSLSGLASGILKNTTGTGVPSVVAAPTGAVVGDTDTQTLTNKSIAASEINSGTLAQARGGTGISNTATLTLGSSNVNLATLGTGIVKNTITTGALTNATSSDVISLFSPGCSGTAALTADGQCHSTGGTGTVTSIATTSPISGGTITTSGTISCPTCAVLSLNTFTRTQTFNPNTATSSASITLDLSQGNVQYIAALATNTTISFTNITAGGTWDFVICENSSGGNTVTWPASFHGAMAITASSTASACNTQRASSPDGTRVIAVGLPQLDIP